MSKVTDGTKRFVNSTKSMLNAQETNHHAKGGVTAVHKKNPPPEQQEFSNPCSNRRRNRNSREPSRSGWL